MKTLILVSDKSQYFFPYYWVDERVVVDNAWMNNRRYKNPFLTKVLRKLKISPSYYWGNWKHDIQQYNKIIIFDGCYDRLLEYYLNRKAKNISKFVYCWNGKNRLKHVFDTKYKIYSYSPEDCKLLHLNYISTMYSDKVKISNLPFMYDIVFIGKTKNRLFDIEMYYQILLNNQLKTLFYVVGDEFSDVVPVVKKIIKYDEYLAMVAKSKAILDLSDMGAQGLSLRVMEAVFLKKKLFTNNINIFQYDFYHENNIFVFGIQPIEDIANFMMKPYYELEENIVEQYEISKWVEQFN